MNPQKFLTQQYGPVSIQRPVFTADDIKEIRRLAGLVRGLDKPMTQFDFAIAYELNIYTLQA